MKNRGDVIGIGATKGASILGLPTYVTAFESWQGWIEKIHPGINARLGYIMPEKPTGPALEWGKAFEGAIIDLAEEEQGDIIVDRELLQYKGLFYKVDDAFSKDGKMLCYLDGRYHTQKLHEGKTTSQYYFRDNFGEPGTDEVPLVYQVQAQHNMMCAGAKELIMSVLVFPNRVEDWEAQGITVFEDKCVYGGYGIYKNDDFLAYPYTWAAVLKQMGNFHQYTIKPRPDLQEMIFTNYRVWWNKHISGLIPPEPTTADDIRRICPEPCGTIIVDDETASWLSDHKLIGQEIGKGGDLAKRREELKIKILNKERKNHFVIDAESANKFIFRDSAGNKGGSYGKNKKGAYTFRS